MWKLCSCSDDSWLCRTGTAVHVVILPPPLPLLPSNLLSRCSIHRTTTGEVHVVVISHTRNDDQLVLFRVEARSTVDGKTRYETRLPNLANVELNTLELRVLRIVANPAFTNLNDITFNSDDKFYATYVQYRSLSCNGDQCL